MASLKLGRFISFVTEPVMNGFLNGLGMLLFKSQLKVFLNPPDLLAAIGLAAFTALLVQGVPKVSKAVPASLAAIVISSGASKALGLNVATLAMTAGDVTFAGGFAVLPRLAAMPDFSLETLQLVVVPAFSIALISSLEMLLAQRVVDDTGVPGKTDPDASIAAMAGGNAISAALGGFGGCGLIPQTLLNSQVRFFA
ncbi:hypothetical protein T492DRAFT_519779 [Pavlovales sp. CCMP2436]|nr:hypothetical protein T492DRAFT_519779 [Pavlovales sp. CCMP2436]